MSIAVLIIALLLNSLSPSYGFPTQINNSGEKMENGIITLRPLRSTDVDAFLTWGSDPEVTQSLFWDPHTDREAAREFLKKVAEPHPWFMAICLDGEPVGAITLDKGSGRAGNRAELGYVLAKKHWGKGIVTQATRMALLRGFEDLGVERIEAWVDPENKGSIKVLESSDMKCEGLLKKYVVHRGQTKDRLIYAKTK